MWEHLGQRRNMQLGADYFTFNLVNSNQILYTSHTQALHTSHTQVIKYIIFTITIIETFLLDFILVFVFFPISLIYLITKINVA